MEKERQGQRGNAKFRPAGLRKDDSEEARMLSHSPSLLELHRLDTQQSEQEQASKEQALGWAKRVQALDSGSSQGEPQDTTTLHVE